MASATNSAITVASAPRNSAALVGSITTKDETNKDSGKEALASCMRSWNYAYRKLAEDDDSTEYECEKAVNKAFLKGMPPLCGYKNICDFIACINYASMTDIVTHNDAAHYLANAKLALSAVYHQPKSPTASSDQPDSTGSEEESRCPDSQKSPAKGGN
jgi:hypothetical protein